MKTPVINIESTLFTEIKISENFSRNETKKLYKEWLGH